MGRKNHCRPLMSLYDIVSKFPLGELQKQAFSRVKFMKQLNSDLVRLLFIYFAEITEMLRKFCSAYQKRFARNFSSVPLSKTENDSKEEIYIGNPKENEVLEHPDYFKVYDLFTVKDLFNAKVHYGHKASSISDCMKPFIFGTRLGYAIFDLDQTAYHLREALNFTAHIAYRDGVILFVSKNPGTTLLVENIAKQCGEFAVTREWILGTFTNAEKFFQNTIRLPDLCIVLNTLQENGHQHHVILEAAKMSIPTVGIVDSNCIPNLITYPVPGNDDSQSSFELYCKLFKEAIGRGKETRKKHLAQVSGAKESADTEVK